MPYRSQPNYGKSTRPRGLNVVYTREVPLKTSVTPRAVPAARQALPRSNRTSDWQSAAEPRRRPALTEWQSARNNFQSSPRTIWQPAATQPRAPRSFKWPVLAFLLSGVFLFAIFHDFSGKENVAQAAFATVSQKSPAAPTKSAEEVRMETYTNAVDAIIAAHKEETIAVSSVDLSNNAALTLGDQGTFTAASTAKLITAVTLLHEVEQGKASLSKIVGGQKAGTLLQNMIINSDNTAWDSLNNDFLSHDILKSYMASQGFIDYNPDVNTLLPSDMAKLMKNLYEGQLLNKTHTDLLLSYMHQANKQEYIVSGVPGGYTVYHKAGWLDGLMHDVAIISNGQKSIVLAIYTYNSTSQGDSTTNVDVFKQITAAATTAYFPAK